MRSLIHRGGDEASVEVFEVMSAFRQYEIERVV